MSSPPAPRADERKLLQDLWPGEKNALWCYGRALLEKNEPADLISFLTGQQQDGGWMHKVAALHKWHEFGPTPLDAQARALALGACHVLLAAAWRLDSREQFYTQLQGACEQYHDAWNFATGRTDSLGKPPAPTFEVRDLVDVPGRYLSHLEDAWGERGPAVAMVRSALAELMSLTGGPGDLLGKRLHVVHLTVLHGGGRGGQGVLTLEWFRRPGGRLTFFPDPVGLGCTTLDQSFTQALSHAWQFAHRKFKGGGWIRWRIDPAPLGPRVGPSAGGAFAACLVGLARGLTFDAGFGFTATVTPAGKLGPVQFIETKARAAIASKHSRTHFVVCKDDRTAHAYLENLFPSVHVSGARTVKGALPLLTGQMDDLIGDGRDGRPKGYLVAVAERLSEQPWYFPRPGTDFFRDLHVQVRVCTRQRDAAELLEHERRRAGQQSTDNQEQPGAAYRAAADENAFEREPPLPWAEARGQFSRAVVLGDPGLGKTTLLRYEGWLVATEATAELQAGRRPIEDIELPVYLRLADLVPVLDEDPVSAVTELAANPKVGGIRLSPEGQSLLRKKVDGGKLVLLLDALDEVPLESLDAVLKWVQGWASSYPSQRVYVTSRHVGYPGSPFTATASSAPELDLIALTPDDIHRFVHGYFGDQTDDSDSVRLADVLTQQLDANPGMLGLAQTPLLLTLICVAFSRGGPGEQLKLPGTRSDLYRSCLRGLLGRWSRTRRRGIDSRLYPSDERLLSDKIDLLAALAWRLAGADPEHTLFTRQEVWEALQQEPGWLQRLGWSSDQALDRLTQADGVLIAIGQEDATRYLFLHRTFQEYLLAWALGRKNNWLDTALSKVYKKGWSEVLALLGGVLGQQEETRRADERHRLEQYLNALVIANRRDLLFRPLVMAARVVAETRHRGGARADGFIAELVELLCRPKNSLVDLGALASVLGEMPEVTIPHLLRSLHDDDEGTRARVIDLLARMGPAAAPAVPGLIRRLRDEGTEECDGEYLRKKVISALGRIGKQAVKHLLPLLIDPVPHVRGRATKVLGVIGSAAAEALPELIKLLADDNKADGDFLSRNAGDAIRSLGPVALPSLIQLLKASRTIHSDQQSLRIHAAWVLRDIGGTAEAAVPELIRMLQADWHREREAAANALGKIGPAAIAAVPHLLPLLANDQDDGRAAAEALGGIGRGAILDLIPLLKDANPLVRAHAAEALGLVGPDAALAIPRLLPLVTDAASASPLSVIVREVVVEALGRIGPASIPHLVPLCRNAELDGVAAQALIKVGAGVIEQLIPLLGETILRVVPYVLNAFQSAAIPLLIPLLDHDDPEVRKNAAMILSIMRPTDELLHAAFSLRGDSVMARECLWRALGIINEERFVLSLVALSQSAELHDLFKKHFSQVGWQDTIPTLITLLKSAKESSERHSMSVDLVRKTLCRIGSPVVPHLIDLLRERATTDVQEQALFALAEIGAPITGGLLPCLFRALQKESRGMQSWVLLAVRPTEALPPEEAPPTLRQGFEWRQSFFEKAIQT
jgi:HEAT repeat protein